MRKFRETVWHKQGTLLEIKFSELVLNYLMSKNYCGPQRNFVYMSSIYQYLLYQKLKQKYKNIYVESFPG